MAPAPGSGGGEHEAADGPSDAEPSFGKREPRNSSFKRSRVTPAPAAESSSNNHMITPEQMAHLERLARRSRRSRTSNFFIDAFWLVADYSLMIGLHIGMFLYVWLKAPYWNWLSFRERGFMFDHASLSMRIWENIMALAVLYSAIYIPLEMVFEEEVQFAGWRELDVVITALFGIDMLVKARSTYTDHGYTVVDQRRVLARYLRSWFVLDLLATAPIDRFFMATDMSPVAAHLAQLLTLLRVARVVRNMSLLEGANALRVVQLMLYFVMIGHWLGAKPDLLSARRMLFARALKVSAPRACRACRPPVVRHFHPAARGKDAHRAGL